MHLLVDKWSGFNKIIDKYKLDEIQYHYITAKTTGICQPLDLFYFRILKSMVRMVVSQALFEISNYY